MSEPKFYLRTPGQYWAAPIGTVVEPKDHAHSGWIKVPGGWQRCLGGTHFWSDEMALLHGRLPIVRWGDEL